jgi:hypothetical protein
VITNTSDWDYFSFYSGSGNASFTVTTPPSGMLDPTIRIVNSSGNVVASADNGLTETINTYLSAGTYYIAVGSHGAYADIGQYNITASLGAGSANLVSTPAAPSNLSATSASTSSASLSWWDNSSNETGFKVERTTNGSNWSEIAVVGAGSTSYTDYGLAAGTSYGYRVHSTNSAGDSAYSNVSWMTTNSNTVAANGSKVTGNVIGTPGSWDGRASDNLYAAVDGSTSTFFDAPTAQAWVGYDLGSARLISGVRYFPRSGQAGRMIGGTIQGSNDSSNWSTIGTINSASEGQWGTLNFSNPTGYRYVRYLSPNGGYGNVAEIEFYSTGSAPITTAPVTTTPPASGTKVTGTPMGTAGSWGNSGNDLWCALDGNLNSFFDAPTSQAWVGYDLGSAKTISSVRYAPRSNQPGRMVGGVFQGSNDASNWSTLATVTSTPAVGAYSTLNVSNTSAFRYVRYLSPDGGYGNVADVEFYANGSTAPSTPSSSKLTGSYFGTPGSYNNSGNDYLCAIDGSSSSFFDAPTSQAYVGIDLGSAKYVASVRFLPRSNQPGRMVGGVFQGSNDNANWTTLYSVNSTPSTTNYTSANVSNPGSYRYVRYLSPVGGYGNVAEVQFYSTAAASESIAAAAGQGILTAPYTPSDEDGQAHVTPLFSTTAIADLLNTNASVI